MQNLKNIQVDDNLNLSYEMEGTSSLPEADMVYNTTAFHWWQEYYYPQVIKESYPVYVQEKSYDKGAKAYEIIKHLKDKDFVKINTAKQFIEIMDSLIKML